MLFDWAAQPFFTVVTTFIFGPYFVSRLTADPVSGAGDVEQYGDDLFGYHRRALSRARLHRRSVRRPQALDRLLRGDQDRKPLRPVVCGSRARRSSTR